MSRRAQPYRASARRQPSAALSRMQRGTGPLPHLQNARRKATRKRKGGRRGNRSYSSPLGRILRKRRKLGGY